VEVRDYLNARPEDTDADLKIRFLAFLAAMFKCAKPIIEEHIVKNQFITYSDVATFWYRHLAKGARVRSVEKEREDFYKGVVMKAKEVLHFTYDIIKF
jgi:hypothetical protein